LERTKKDLERVAEQLKAKRREAEELESVRQKHTNELFQLVGDSQADISQYAESIKALQTEQLALRQKLTSGIASLSLPLAMSKTGQRLASAIESERIRDEWLHLKQAALGKAERIVREVLPEDGGADFEPPLLPGQREALKSRLETALEALWSPPPDGCAEGFRFVFLRESDRAAVLSKVHRVLKHGAPDLQQTVLDWNRVSTQLREAQRKFEAIRDVEPKLVELRKVITDVGERISIVSAELNGLENKEKALSTHIKDLRGAIGQMEKRQSIADPVQQKINVAYQVTEVLDEAGERLVPLCKEALEERCTYHFTQMISDEYKQFQVRFDADTEPRLEKDDQVVYVAALSGAQKRAFGLAFTLAVADVSHQQAPIVIDTPVGNMDSRYRDRVLRHVAESAPGQVIFLSHDEEISPDYAEKLDEYVAKTMLLSFTQVEEGSGVTTVEDGVYFGVTA
jgi:DNA sulfur modification protein DndD